MRTHKISEKAQIGNNVEVGPYTIIHDDVIIGDGTTIGSHCIIGLPTKRAKGQPLKIGHGSVVRSHCVLYQGSEFGPKLDTGHSVHIRENTIAGINLRAGTLCNIQGECSFGDCVRMHSEVHVAQKSEVGDFVWMYPGVKFTNDPFPPSDIEAPIFIDDMAVIATGALLLPGINIGTGAFVAAGSVVGTNVAAVECVRGNPAKRFAWLDQFVSFEYSLQHPWSNHYRRIPKECLDKLDKTGDRIKALMQDLRTERKTMNKRK